MLKFLITLDRRWIFLLMLLSVALPILFTISFPEQPTDMVRSCFDEIDRLPEGSKILLAWDWDPASEGELGPMATAFTRHCAEKHHKLYFIALWPLGPQMIDDTINKVIKPDFPELVEGKDYCNLGFKPGNEGVIKVIVTDLRQLYTTDHRGTSLDRIPMCQGIASVRDFDLVVEVGAGYAGLKEWIQYAATPYPGEIKVIGGTTGVTAPQLYPYYPDQMPGMLGAIKGAAEYETLVNEKYPLETVSTAKYTEALRRMGPQLIAHILMILLIVVGNVVYFWDKASRK